LLRARPNQTHDDYAWTVYTTWQISFDRLSKVAAQLLQLSSFLHHEGITEKMLSNAVLYDSTVLGEMGPTAQDLEDAQKFLAEFLTPSGTWDRLAYAEITAEIEGYSLIEVDSQKELYSIHPLVQDWTRESVTDPHLVQECIAAIVGMCVPLG
ncbi:hypothetical protein B0H13DRAFT_1570121, partial [Mycena leptocephala]